MVQHLFHECGFSGNVRILLERPEKRKGDLLEEHCRNTEDW